MNIKTPWNQIPYHEARIVAWYEYRIRAAVKQLQSGNTFILPDVSHEDQVINFTFRYKQRPNNDGLWEYWICNDSRRVFLKKFNKI